VLGPLEAMRLDERGARERNNALLESRLRQPRDSEQGFITLRAAQLRHDCQSVGPGFELQIGKPKLPYEWWPWRQRLGLNSCAQTASRLPAAGCERTQPSAL